MIKKITVIKGLLLNDLNEWNNRVVEHIVNL